MLRQAYSVGYGLTWHDRQYACMLVLVNDETTTYVSNFRDGIPLDHNLVPIKMRKSPFEPQEGLCTAATTWTYGSVSRECDTQARDRDMEAQSVGRERKHKNTFCFCIAFL